MPSQQRGYGPAALGTRPSSCLPQLPYVHITRINLGHSLPLLTSLCLVFPSNGTPVWLKKPGQNLLSIYGKGRKRQERGRRCPTKSRQTPFFPGFHLTWQLLLTHFPLLLPNLPNAPTPLGPQLLGMGSRSRHRLRVDTPLGPADGSSHRERFRGRPEQEPL